MGYKELATAIVESACADYVRYGYQMQSRKRKGLPVKPIVEREFNDAKKFFESGYLSDVVEVDKIAILEALDKKIERKLKEHGI